MGKTCSWDWQLATKDSSAQGCSAIFFSGHTSTEFYCIYLNNQSDNCVFDEIAIPKGALGQKWWDSRQDDLIFHNYRGPGMGENF